MRYLLLVLILMLSVSCITMKKHNKLMKDYQILLYMDSVWIYDKGRSVGKFVHLTDSSWKNQYDSIFTRDNL